MSMNLKATIIWIILLLLSAIGAYIGETGQINDLLILLIVVILIVKGQLVVDHFMGLRRVKAVWRVAMSAFGVVIGAVILATYHLV